MQTLLLTLARHRFRRTVIVAQLLMLNNVLVITRAPPETQQH